MRCRGVEGLVMRNRRVEVKVMGGGGVHGLDG
jgi:hypothetical protein